MVAVLSQHNEDLIFLRFSLNILGESGVLFSDGNAASSKTQFFEFIDLDSLSVLDAKAIQTVCYSGDQELKRKKQSEILIPNRVEVCNIFDILTFSNSAQSKVLAEYERNAIKAPSVSVSRGWYFIDKNSQKGQA